MIAWGRIQVQVQYLPFNCVQYLNRPRWYSMTAPLPELRLSAAHFDVAVLYASHGGQSRELAEKFSRELEWRLNVRVRCASLGDFRHSGLSKFPRRVPLVLFVSSRGNGEPTISGKGFAQALSELLPDDPTSGSFEIGSLDRGPKSSLVESQHLKSQPDVEQTQIPTDQKPISTHNSSVDMDNEQLLPEDSTLARPLLGLKYCVFGRGSTLYKDTYNAAARRINSQMARLGAKQIVPYCESDSFREFLTENRYFSWKENAMTSLSKLLGKPQQPYQYIPKSIVELLKLDINLTALEKLGPEDSGPSPCMTVAHTKQWYDATTGRLFANVTFDLRGTKLKYQTGDYVLVWPQNHPLHVQKFLQMFKLAHEMHDTLRVNGDYLTTWHTLASRHFAISSVVSRELLQQMQEFVVNPKVKLAFTKLISNFSKFREELRKARTLAQLMDHLSDGDADAFNVPPSFLIDLMPKLTPRYYSAVSSSVLQPESIEITAVVAGSGKRALDHGYLPIPGVASRYLYSLGMDPNDVLGPVVAPSSNKLCKSNKMMEGPTNQKPSRAEAQFASKVHWGACQYVSPHKVVISVRPSPLRLPSNSNAPLIFIGLGTGISAFRGLIEERWMQRPDKQTGSSGIKDMLFAGCHGSESLPQHDFFSSAPGLTLITAYSRQQGAVYVQQRLWENRDKIIAALNAGATIYSCGSIQLVGYGVRDTLINIIAESRMCDFDTAKAELKHLQKIGRYIADMW